PMCSLFSATRCLWFIACTGWPRKKNSPDHALSSMPRIASNVDLPAPDGPMIETNSPGWISPVIRRSTNVRPAGVSNTFSMLRIEIRGPTIGAGGASRETVLGWDVKNAMCLERYLLAAALFDHPSVEQVNRPIRVGGIAGIVRHHADRRTTAMELAEQLHHGFAVRRVEV